ncbi:MAG: hypothetical protein PVH40_01160 [Gemmatimonadales bacterium]|jgi:hypothetical protein
MRHLHTRIGGLLLAATLIACQSEIPNDEPSQPSQDVMRSAPLYQPSTMVARRGSAETLELVFHSPSAPDSVASWYRDRVLAMGWDIIGDAIMPDGAVSLHVQRDGPPLWVIIRSGEEGSEFSLIGAAPDTTAGTEP